MLELLLAVCLTRNLFTLALANMAHYFFESSRLYELSSPKSVSLSLEMLHPTKSLFEPWLL
jgi:hypothetical protein